MQALVPKLGSITIASSVGINGVLELLQYQAEIFAPVALTCVSLCDTANCSEGLSVPWEYAGLWT